MKFKMEVKGAEALKKVVRVDVPDIADETTKKGVVSACLLVEGDAKKYIRQQGIDEFQEKAFALNPTTYLAASSLQRITGNLAASITHEIAENSKGQIEGLVGTNMLYARIHEIGGVINAKYAPFLVFMTADGLWHRVKSVTMPARPFLMPALLKNNENIQKLFSKTFWDESAKKGIR